MDPLTNWDALPLILNAADVARVMGLSRPLVYGLFARKGFPAIRLSANRLAVPRDALRRWLDEQAGMGDPSGYRDVRPAGGR